MIRYIKIFVGILFLSFALSQDLEVGDISIELTILNTGVYTSTSFGVVKDLWSIRIENQTSKEQNYRKYYELIRDGELVSWGLSPIEKVDNDPVTIYNNDPFFTNELYLDQWYGKEFIDIVNQQGYLPPGSNYILTVSIVRTDDKNFIISSDSKQMEINLGSQTSFNITSPGDLPGQVIEQDSDFIFYWKSPGFRSGVKIEYRMIVAAIVPGVTISPEDAIDSGSSLVYYYDSGINDLDWEIIYGSEATWPVVETGISRELNVFYINLLSQGSMPELICGYEYAWRMQAREVIDNFNDNGNKGIWGWESEQWSSVYTFTYGGLPYNLESPDGLSVLPIFYWNNIFCSGGIQGNGYEIEVKNIDDTFDEQNTFISQTSDYQYQPGDLPILVPSKTYKWRARLNSFNEDLPWSNELGEFTIKSLSNPYPQGVINTVRPEFIIDGPDDIASYKLQIFSETDDDVYVNEDLDIDLTTGWTFTTDENYYGLFPAISYSYLISPQDWDGNILGEDINTIAGSFIIDYVMLDSPSDNSLNMPLNPFFKWNGPLSVPGYFLEITNIGDENFISPNISILTKGSTSFEYPHNGEYPLEYEKIYLWRVLPTNFKYQIGPIESFSPFYQFTTSEYAELVQPLSGTILETVRPTFEINIPEGVEYLTFRITDENDENIENPEIYNEIEKLSSSTGNFISWQYPNQDVDFGLHPGMKYYWQYLMYNVYDELIGQIEEYEVLFFSINSISLQVPEKSAKNIPLNQTFRWEGPDEVPEYEFWISGENDPELENPTFKIEGINGKSFEYPINGDFPLEYEKKYYWRIVSKDINGNLGLSSSYSEIFEFTASNFPQMGEELSISSVDPRIPIINIAIIEDNIEYTINIYSDPEGSSIIEQISGITKFPYEYTNGIETLQYASNYYIQIQRYKNDELFGPPSIMMPFSIPEKPDNTQQCEISCQITDGVEPEILTTILEGIEGATEYLLILSENEDLSDPTIITLTSGQSEYLISSEYVDWGQTYYTQVVARDEEENVGLPSDIQIINIENKPGMDEQTAISVILPEGSIKPVFEIINEITGADGYRINISTEPDMSQEFWQFEFFNLINADYPSDAPILEYGASYYVTAHAIDENELHGIESNIVGFYIPNITPPILGDAFSWEKSVPPAVKYFLEVSLVEDFSVIVLEKIIEGTNYELNMDELEFEKGYYWRVQGLDDSDNKFGNTSQVQFFQTEEYPKPILNSFTQEVSLNPEFSWEGINMANSYQITVSSDQEMNQILWQINSPNFSVLYPESAILLEFDKTYYWQVIALDENDIPISESLLEIFSTASIYPIQGLKPDGGIQTLSPLLEWEGSEKAASYLIQIALDEEMNELIFSEVLESPSIQIQDEVLLFDNTYYWNVDGLDENGETLAGTSKTAILLMPSVESISLLFPIDGEELTNLQPTFKWSALLGISNYTLIISIDPSFENIFLNSIVSGTELTLTDENKLNNSTTYYWKIEASTEEKIISTDFESFSSSKSATISIQSLENGASISVSNPVFTWQIEEEITAFAIRFAENIEFSDSWEFSIGSNSFEYPEDPALDYNTTYYWQVIPLDNEENPVGDWTLPRSFSISPAFNIDLVLPENGTTANSKNPTFQWSSIEGVTKYEIQVSSIEDFTEILWSSSEIVENQTNYPSSGSEPLEYGKMYYWRVRCLGEENPLGNYSSIFSFDISSDSKVILEGPLSESETLFPYFSWEAVNSAIGYTIILGSDESISTIVYTTESSEVFLQYPESAPPLSNGVQYYWSVFATDENGVKIGDGSDIGSFTTPEGIIEIEFIFEP